MELIKNNFGIVKAHEIFYMRANKYILSNNFDVVFTRDPGYLPFLVKLKNKATNLFDESKKSPTIMELIELITSSYEKFFLNLNQYKYILQTFLSFLYQ